MPDVQDQFEQLVAAVLAYDAAIKAHARAERWTESDELDRLYVAMLRAAGVEPDADRVPE